MSCNRPEWYGCKTLSQIVVRSLRHVVAPRMSCDVWYPHRSQVPNASFFSVVRPSLVRAATLGGGGNVRDVVLHRMSQSPCLVDSEQPMTVHPVMGKTPSQIGQTSLSVLSTWVQYPPPYMDDPSLSRRSSFTDHVPRSQCCEVPSL